MLRRARLRCVMILFYFDSNIILLIIIMCMAYLFILLYILHILEMFTILLLVYCTFKSTSSDK